MSQSGALSGGGGPPGSGIQTITTDSGAISGTNVVIYANTATLNSGSTVTLVATSGTTAQLNVTDSNTNTIIGNLSGVVGAGSLCTGLGADCLAAISTDSALTAIGYKCLLAANGSAQNTGVGVFCLTELTTGQGNTSVGIFSMGHIVTGSFNTCLGYAAGQLLGGAESNNILLAHSGVNGESNAMRLGRTGSGSHQVDSTYIAGVNGVSVADPLIVVIDSVTEQLGTVALEVNVQTFTTSGTYTPTAGMQFVKVQVCGGGGGGGGSPDLSASTNFVGPGAGGGAAGYSEGLFDAVTIGASQVVTVGTGGAGGLDTGTTGSDGTLSSFGALISTGPGIGGIGSGVSVSDSIVNLPLGGAGGTATGGYLNIPGGIGDGAAGFSITTLGTPSSALYAEGGRGASTPLGSGGPKSNVSNPGQTGIIGFNGAGYGSGGGGAATVNNSITGTGMPGGNGAPGIVIVTEYILG